MAGSFADRLARARRSVDATFAEEWIFRPMAWTSGPNVPAMPDPEREIVDPFMAIAKEIPEMAFETARGVSFAPTPSAGSILRVDYVASDAIDLRQGDRLERKASGVVYAVTRPRPLGRGRMTVDLSLAR